MPALRAPIDVALAQCLLGRQGRLALPEAGDTVTQVCRLGGWGGEDVHYCTLLQLFDRKSVFVYRIYFFLLRLKVLLRFKFQSRTLLVSFVQRLRWRMSVCSDTAPCVCVR